MRTLALLSLSLTACVPGVGAAKFTTWGEEYIEQEIPADPAGESGFADGWHVHYDKFMVTYHGFEVASEDGTVGAQMSGSKLVDNARTGKKDLITFEDLEARAWDAVSYEIKPATPATELIGGATEADRRLMVEGGYSVYFEGSATRTTTSGATLSKTFHLGFPLKLGFFISISFQYNCPTIRLDQNIISLLQGFGTGFFSNIFSITVNRRIHLNFYVTILNTTSSTVTIQNLVTIFTSWYHFTW